METNHEETLKDSLDFIKVSAPHTFHKRFDFENDRIYYDLEKNLKTQWNYTRKPRKSVLQKGEKLVGKHFVDIISLWNCRPFSFC